MDHVPEPSQVHVCRNERVLFSSYILGKGTIVVLLVEVKVLIMTSNSLGMSIIVVLVVGV